MSQPQPPLPQASALSQMRDLLANLQDRAAQLDTQMTELSKALDHWRLLGAEYEALADEVNQARDKSVTADEQTTQRAQQSALVRIRRDFDGQLVDHQTVCDLFGARQGQTITRSIDHISSAIGRRLDHVNQNTATLEKKVEAVVKKLSALQLGGLTEMLAEDDKAEGDEGQDNEGNDDVDMDGPVTDIVEQLDEDGNVIDVQLHTPSNTQDRVMEALKKAGIEEIPAGGPSAAKKTTDTTTTTTTKEMTKVATETKDAPKEQPQASKLKPNTSATRKGVSFSDDTKADDSSSSSQPTSFAAQRLENIMRSAKEQESIVDTSTTIVPEEEAADEAALRREMLEYSMSEIGPIVAQLDLEEGTSDEDEGYDDFYDDEFDDDDDDDEEDEHGRSKYSVIDETYRERMRELERKLGVAPLERPSTLAPVGGDSATATATTTDDMAESLGRIRVSGLTAATASTSNGDGSPTTSDLASPKSPASLTSVLKEPTENFRTKVKATGSDAKKVSFASSVDIAPLETVLPAAPAVAPKPKVPVEPVVDPMSEVIVERGSGGKQNGAGSSVPQLPSVPDANQKPKRVSRFKKARGDGAAATPDTVNDGLPKGPHQAPVRFLDEDRTVAPEGPEGKTHADQVIERSAVTKPKEPHELDAGILMQEAATEYHKTRNRLIQQQGGFLQASESAVVLVGLEDGGPRISKFKAAKLGKQFMNP
ncbi:hypothetical protein Sste5346_000452 [Sporothrix stenoceras]|uniref:DUF3835 domain-containing protein n=1 Tax=Sporothrix stenoceras TaxID=5173 RepID=A0ABR3ZSN7_9PEZI